MKAYLGRTGKSVMWENGDGGLEGPIYSVVQKEDKAEMVYFRTLEGSGSAQLATWVFV